MIVVILLILTLMLFGNGAQTNVLGWRYSWGGLGFVVLILTILILIKVIHVTP